MKLPAKSDRQRRQRIGVLLSLALLACLVPIRSQAQCDDSDGDGYGVGPACAQPTDCNDADPLTFPGGPEMCDGFDRDCDGVMDNAAQCVQTCLTPERIGGDVLVSVDPLEDSGNPFFAWSGTSFLALWEKRRGNDESIASQLIASDGSFIGPRVDLANVALARGQSVVWNGSEFGAAWFERDNGISSVRFVAYSASGQPVLPVLVLDESPDSAVWPVVAWTGTEYGVTWFAVESGVRVVKFARIDAAGNVLTSSILTPGVESWHPKIAWNGEEYGVSWARDPFGAAPSLRFLRLDSQGSPIGSDFELAPMTSAGPSDLAWADGEYAVVFTRDVGGDDQVHLVRVGADGVEIGNEIQVTFSPAEAESGHLAWNGSEYGLVWQDTRHDGQDYELYFRTVGSTGTLGAELRLTEAPDWSYSPQILWTGSEYGVVWTDFRNGQAQVFFMRIGCDCSEDNDGDAVSVCNDCDEFSSAVYPEAPQICDGLNNDCSHPSYPALTGTTEFDDDGDSLSECAGDCDDADATVFAGALEINDGIDNQCPGEVGYGVADETSGNSGFLTPGDTDRYSWPAQPGATSYEVARSSTPDFSTCVLNVVTEPSWKDVSLPAAGSAFFYLNRPATPHLGSWGQNGAGIERIVTCF